ncbi:hypothetical protein GQ44DRAFT_776753 [Phaeosphaeriaceae sp. PMI808]|nr:hypothetical protein GQ44DRAFT_776753 [Phaeosphaeriaceae sp. PMI808]
MKLLIKGIDGHVLSPVPKDPAKLQRFNHNSLLSKDPNTPLRQTSQALAGQIASIVHEADELETKVRRSVFYFFLFIIACLRLEFPTTDEAHDLLKVAAIHSECKEWLQRLLNKVFWLNDSIIGGLLEKGWPLDLATTAVSLIAPTRPWRYSEILYSDRDAILERFESFEEFFKENATGLDVISGPDYIIKQVPELQASYDKICDVLTKFNITKPTSLSHPVPAAVGNSDTVDRNRMSDKSSTYDQRGKTRRIEGNSSIEPNSTLRTLSETELSEENSIPSQERHKNDDVSTGTEPGQTWELDNSARSKACTEPSQQPTQPALPLRNTPSNTQLKNRF